MAKKRRKRRKSGLPRELERAGALCLAFANTAAPRRDDRRKGSAAPPATRLASYADLVRWAQRMGTVGAAEGEQLISAAAARPEDAAVFLADALELRATVMRIFTALVLKKEPQAKDLATLNAYLRPRHVIPERDGFRREWGGDADALDRPLWAVAHSAAELLSSDQHHKIRQCATKGCYRLFVYGNSRRLWCDENTCGSRSRGRRHHEQIRQIKKRLAAMSPAERHAHLARQDEMLKELQANREMELTEIRKRVEERYGYSTPAVKSDPDEPSVG